MQAFTCDKCSRRFTLSVEELQGYLAQSLGQKHAAIACPHCGRHNKVAVQRLQQAVRFLRPAPTGIAEPAEQTAPETAEEGV